MEVAKRIEEIRKRKDIKKIDIPVRLGKHHSWYSKLLKGDVKVMADQIPIIAKTLGVTITEIYHDESERYKEVQLLYGRLNEIRDLVNKDID